MVKWGERFEARRHHGSGTVGDVVVGEREREGGREREREREGVRERGSERERARKRECERVRE